MPKTFLPSPTQRLRMLAHTRRLGGIMLPFGAAIGLAVALALRGLGFVGPWVGRVRGETYPTVVIPATGLFLVTLWLSSTGIGEVSLFKDTRTCSSSRACLPRGLSRRAPVAFVGAANESTLVPAVFLAKTTAQTALVIPALIATGVTFLVSRERA